VPCVLFVSPVAEAGGSDQALLRLVRSLCANGFTCVVTLPGLSPLQEEFANAGAIVDVVPMRRITSGGGLAWWARYAAGWPLAIARLVRLIRTTRADIVASNSLHTWYGWAAARLTRRPHIWHAREIVVQSRAALGFERRLVQRFADLLIACSHAAAHQFADVLPAERILVIHEDVDRAEFTPKRSGAFRQAYGFADDTPLVGFVGRVDTWKGVDVLLDAWPRVLGRHPEAQLAIVGGPVTGKERYHDQLRERSAKLEGVTWIGRAADAADVMADIDVLAAPSTLPEPYGLVLVEALASGAHVVTSDAGGAPEIVAKAASRAGQVVVPGDPGALADAISDQVGAVSTTSTVTRRSRPVLIEPFPTDWAKIYERVVRSRRSAPTASR